MAEIIVNEPVEDGDLDALITILAQILVQVATDEATRQPVIPAYNQSRKRGYV